MHHAPRVLARDAAAAGAAGAAGEAGQRRGRRGAVPGQLEVGGGASVARQRRVAGRRGRREGGGQISSWPAGTAGPPLWSPAAARSGQRAVMTTTGRGRR